MRMLLASVGLVAAVVATGCSSDPDADPALVRALDEVGTTLYLPDLRGAGLSDLEVAEGRVQAELEGTYGTLLEMAYVDDDRPLCRALRRTYLSDSDCSATDDSIVASFEEMVTIAVVRGGTVLAIRTVDEADPTIVDDALAALRSAPEASARELAEAAS